MCLDCYEIIEFINNKENKIKYPYFFSEIFKDGLIPSDANLLDNALLDKIKNYKIKEYGNQEKKNYHGKLVVEKIQDFKEFIMGWRNYFTDVMKPIYLPLSWNDDRIFSNFGEESIYKNDELININ